MYKCAIPNGKPKRSPITSTVESSVETGNEKTKPNNPTVMPKPKMKAKYANQRRINTKIPLTQYEVRLILPVGSKIT